MGNLKAVAISGSLRKDSLNRKALKIAKKIAQELGIEVIEVDLKVFNLPIYDGDIEDAGMPEKVVELKEIVESADILIIASPEYNHSISGALKNAIDWLTRGNNSLTKKIAAIFGVSSGSFGTVRGQNHLRQILAALNVYVIPQPQVFIANGETAFYADGSLKNNTTYELLETLIKKAYEIALKFKTN
jgi:chromate reductase